MTANTNMLFPELEMAIFERGMKKKVVAQKLNISQKTLSNKLTGKSQFTWKEVCLLQTFFPDIPKERLLQENPNQSNAFSHSA